MKRWKQIGLFLALFGTLWGCTSPVAELLTAVGGVPGSRTLLTGPQGSVTVTGMTTTNLTVTFSPSSAVDSARLFVTQGNGLGLVLANQAMTNSGGTWSYSFGHASFTPGAKIGLTVLTSAAGVEKSVPQGALADASTWASFTYGSAQTSATVTYDSQGATVAASPASQTVTNPATTVGTLPTAPTKTGYTFGGWFTAAKGAGTAFTGTTPVSTTLTVYAQWIAVTSGTTLSGPNGSLVVSGMTDTSLTVSYTPGSAIASARLFVSQGNGTGLILASQAMTNTGGTYRYTLSHPTFTNGAKIYLDVLKAAAEVETNVPQGSLATVTTWSSFNYASSPVNSFTVTYDGQGATAAPNPSSQTVTSPATTVGALPSAPTKSGFTFVGWFTAPNGAGTAFTASTTVSASVTVYALWAPVQTTIFTVTYDSQGATVAASPASQVVTSPATTVGTLPAAPTKTGSLFLGWYTVAQGAGTAFTATTPVTQSLTVYASWRANNGTVDLGPNVLIFDPTMAGSAIQSKVDQVFNAMRSAQFSSNRYALLFKPGSYAANVNVGFYTQVLGLGRNVDDTLITGSIQSDGAWDPNHNVTENFWRSVENIAVAPTSYGRNMWAVSQAAPARRFHVKGDLWLFDINPANGASGWASGGFMADSWVDGAVNPGGQQQWLSRNSKWSSAAGGVWNMVFVGDNNAPATSFGAIPNYTTLASTPVVKEKPYLYVDAAGAYQVFVPSVRSNSQGLSWANGSTPGASLPIGQFYIAHPETDTASTMNAALASGLNLLLTPGIYALTDTLQVNRANTVVLGLGMATLLNTTGLPAMTVADVDGVVLAGILFDAGTVTSPCQLQVGPPGSAASHGSNPILLADLFFRVGGAVAGKTITSLIINSNDVIGDDFWIWRADHGVAGTWGWTTNTAKNGLIVNGSNVTVYGLFVEHYQAYQTIWNGNGGRVYFYQSEIPYDVPNQASWMNGTSKGFASYKVANAVTSHMAYGVGVYCFFNVNGTLQLDSAIEVPASGLNGAMFHNVVTVALGTAGAVGQINHVINNVGAMTNDVGTPTYLVQ